MSVPGKRFATLLWMVLFLSPAWLVAATSFTPFVLLRHGDDPRWAARDLDDRDWLRIELDEFPSRQGPYWVRFHFGFDGLPTFFDGPAGRYPARPAAGPVDSLFISTVYAFELYWDGHLLARGGRVGASRDEEIAGPLDHLVRIPPELLTPGPHVVAMRMSSHRYNFSPETFHTSFRLENYTSRLIFESRRVLFPVAGAAGALLMGIVSLLLHVFMERRRALVLCAALCATLTAFYLLISLRWLIGHPYDWHAPRLAAVTGLTAVIGVLLTWLLLELFAIPRKWIWLAALVPLLVAAWYSDMYYEIRALWMARAMLALGLAVAAWAALRRRPGATAALIGMAIGLVIMRSSGRVFMDPTYFLLLGGVVLLVFATLGLQVQAERRKEREMRLTAARLEIELLRRNLQPHFLMNTLTTLIEVIEREPGTAVALIEDLARECRILARVSGEKLIAVDEELELCRAHLGIMSLRRGMEATLAVRNVDGRAQVPPALFHTLIENGLTHLRPRAGRLRFELTEERRSGRVRYALLAEGDPSKAKAGEAPRDGTGVRYIKARLEESFPGSWELQGGPVGTGWLTTIDLPATARLEAPK